MTAFPSGSGNNVNTSNLDSASDQPKQARADLLTLTQRVNQIINSYNTSNGICGLNASGKVDTAKLIGQIGSAQLVADSVNGDKIADDSIDSEHIVDGAVDLVHTSFTSTDDTLGGVSSSDLLVPTQDAVKTFTVDYVDSQIKTLDTGYTTLGTETASGTASADGFIICSANGDSDDRPDLYVTIAGVTLRNDTSDTSSVLVVPIASGESYSAVARGSNSQKIRFKGFS